MNVHQRSKLNRNHSQKEYHAREKVTRLVTNLETFFFISSDNKKQNNNNWTFWYAMFVVFVVVFK